jgi:hypothetical protein
MAYLEITWGGVDSGTTNNSGTISSQGKYPAGRAAYNVSAGSTTYPILVTSVGASIAAGGDGGSDRSGTLTIGAAVSEKQDDIRWYNNNTSNIPIQWYDVNPDKLINVSAAVQQSITPFKWVGNTFSVYAGRDGSTSYDTTYNGVVRDGRMGGGMRYYLAPAQPGTVIATASTTQSNRIDLAWSSPDDGGTAITGYNVYRSTATTSLGTQIGTTTGTGVTYSDTDTSKVIGTKYYYHVTAKNAVTTAAGSSVSSVVSYDPATGDGAFAPGAPNKPVISSATRSTTTAGVINVTWTGSVPTGSPSQTFNIYRNAVLVASSVSSPYSDTGLTKGTTYSYTITAVNTVGSVTSDAVSAMAPGTPSEPQSISLSSKVGRTVTMSHQNIVSGGDYGNSVTEYRMQISTDGGTTWKGWNNTTKSFTSDGTYNVTTSGSFQYLLLTPALTYLFRVYAVNSIGNGSAVTTSTGLFVSAGGRRFRSPSEPNPGTFQPTETAKRYGQTSAPGVTPVTYGWIDLVVAKRYEPTNPNAVNGWVDLS